MATGLAVRDAVAECAPGVSHDRLEEIVRTVVQDRHAFVKEKGMGALGPLMGIVMVEVRGSVDGKLVSQVLRQEISRHLSVSTPGDKV